MAYNAFLYASILDEVGATPLSTVSALARLDIDPWQEAAELARLPRKSATPRLAALLDRLPAVQTGRSDVEATAMRLVGLLPAQASAEPIVPGRAETTGGGFNIAFAAMGFGMAVVVLLTNLLPAPANRTGGEASVSPAGAAGAPAPAAPQPKIGR